MNRKELLQNSPIFSGLGKDAIASLDKLVIQKNYSRGEMLFSEGEEAAALFILASGAVDLIKSSPDGKEQLIRTVGIGESFAEAAMFSGAAYPVTALAKESSSVLVIQKDKFLNFISTKPAVSLAMMGAMAKLLRHLNTLVANLSLGSVASRLASYLLERSEETKSSTFDLGIKKQELAFQLGTIPETLSRNFRKFSDDGLIKIDKNRVTIIDRDRLNILISK